MMKWNRGEPPWQKACPRERQPDLFLERRDRTNSIFSRRRRGGRHLFPCEGPICQGEKCYHSSEGKRFSRSATPRKKEALLLFADPAKGERGEGSEEERMVFIPKRRENLLVL